MFGKGFAFKTEVTNGTCPMCSEHTVFVSLYQNIYRCITCGADTEQKVFNIQCKRKVIVNQSCKINHQRQ